HTGGERPVDAQIFHVVPVDLLQLAVAPVLEIPRLHHPVLRAFRESGELLVGSRYGRQPQSQSYYRHTLHELVSHSILLSRHEQGPTVANASWVKRAHRPRAAYGRSKHIACR